MISGYYNIGYRIEWFPQKGSVFIKKNLPILKKLLIFGKLYYFCNSLLKLRVMKKRSFYAIVLVAIGLFLSINLGSFALNASAQSADTGGGTSSSMASGVYVPD